MPRLCMVLALGFVLVSSSARARPRFLGDEGPGTFAVPSILKPNVTLWSRVYGVYDSSQQIYYDTKNLDILLHVADLRPFSPGPSDQAAERRKKARQRVDHVEAERQRVQAALLRLERGKRSGLSKLERKLLAAYAGRRAALAGAHKRVGAHGGLRDRFGEGLKRLARYRPYVVEVLRRYELPSELVALAMTESLFNPKARSHAGAYGIWQFLKGTGREYLHINDLVDERRDPIVSTDGAARMLRNNLRRLKKWPLALSGYHYGPNGMARAAKEVGSHDLVQILKRWKSKRFKFASRNYYASFLAALKVIQGQKKYFPELKVPEPVRFETVSAPRDASVGSVAKRCGAKVGELAELNPALTEAVVKSQRALPAGYPLRVPVAAAARCVRQFGKASAAKPFQKARTRAYKVVRGDSFLAVARRAGVTLTELLALNGLKAPRALRVGEVLRVPSDRSGGFTFVPVSGYAVARADRPPSDRRTP